MHDDTALLVHELEDTAHLLPLVSIVLCQKAPDALACGQKGIQIEEEGLRFTRGLLFALADEVLKEELGLAELCIRPLTH
jgi:hypothetical protein